MSNLTLHPCPYCRDVWISQVEDVCISCARRYDADLAIADLQDSVTRLSALLSEISAGRLLLIEDAKLQLESMIETIMSKS